MSKTAEKTVKTTKQKKKNTIKEKWIETRVGKYGDESTYYNWLVIGKDIELMLPLKTMTDTLTMHKGVGSGY